MTQKLSISLTVSKEVHKGPRQLLPAKVRVGAAVLALPLLALTLFGCGGSEQSKSAENASGRDTARISGPDPATLAVNVAYAVYPVETLAQRPKTVTLVAEDNWQNAVAAAVFMARPVGSPLLISSAGGTPEPTTAAINVFQPHGKLLKPSGNASREGPAFLVTGSVATPTGGRTAATGDTSGARQAASVEAFRKTLARAVPKRVVLVPENDPAFALPAAAWAAHSGDPILFTRKDELPRATVGALRRFPAFVYVLGPPSVISPAVVAELGKLATGVKRISGETPAENAVAFARYADGDFGWNVDGPGHGFVIARSDEPFEAALSSPLSTAGPPGPLLLTESAERLPEAVRKYLLEVGSARSANSTGAPRSHVWIVGDEESISADQQAEIEELTAADGR